MSPQEWSFEHYCFMLCQSSGVVSESLLIRPKNYLNYSSLLIRSKNNLNYSSGTRYQTHDMTFPFSTSSVYYIEY